MLPIHARSHFRSLFAALAAGCFLLAAAQPAGANAGSAATSARGCAGRTDKVFLKDGTLRLFSRTDTRRRVYACTSKYGKRYRPEPTPDFELDGFGGRTYWSGRYLYYTYTFTGATTIGGSTARLIDMKTGRTTRKIPAPVIDGRSSTCTFLNCQFETSVGVLGRGTSYAVAVRWFGESTFQVQLHCINAGFTRHTASVVDRGLTPDDAVLLKTTGSRFTWVRDGVRRSARFCES